MTAAAFSTRQDRLVSAAAEYHTGDGGGQLRTPLVAREVALPLDEGQEYESVRCLRGGVSCRHTRGPSVFECANDFELLERYRPTMVVFVRPDEPDETPDHC